MYVPEAQGSLPSRRHALYARRTRTSLGRAVRTCTVAPQDRHASAEHGKRPLGMVGRCAPAPQIEWTDLTISALSDSSASPRVLLAPAHTGRTTLMTRLVRTLVSGIGGYGARRQRDLGGMPSVEVLTTALPYNSAPHGLSVRWVSNNTPPMTALRPCNTRPDIDSV